MLKAVLRPAMIMLPFFAGLFCPQAHILNESPFHLVPVILIVMIFVSALQLEFRELAPRKEHFILVAVNILIALVPWGLCRIFLPEATDLAWICFFTGIMPSATSSPVIISFLDGKVGFTLTGFVVSTFLISLALVLFLPLVTGNCSFAFFGNVLVTVSMLIIFPILAAFLVQKIWPSSRNIPRKYKEHTFFIWCVLLFIIAAIARNYLLKNPRITYSSLWIPAAISGVMSIINFCVGKHLPRGRYPLECGQLLGQKNTSFGIYIALLYANPYVTFGPIFYVFWHNVWNACQLFQHERQKKESAGEK